MARSNRDWLPADLMTEILLKLPVNSIIRFKCVAKAWCHLFQNPRFISNHLSISKKNKRLLVHYSEGTPVVVHMRLFIDQALVSYQDMRQKLPSRFADMFVFIFCVDNGLLCLCDDTNSRITLCNPATREFRILPECNENLPPHSFTLSHALGFGLDPLSNDYKVIYIRSFVDEENDMPMLRPDHYAVYKMRTNSWKVFKPDDFQFSAENLGVCHSDSNACVNGVYYWQTKRNILAFYLDTEVFQLIDSPCPESFGCLTPLYDRISCWVTEIMDRSENSTDVWVLNDEGYWTKVLKIEPILNAARIFGFWKNDKVLVEFMNGQLLLYDLETKEFSEFGIKNRGYSDLLEVYTYEESLVIARL